MIPKFRTWDSSENKFVTYPVFIDSDGDIYWEHYERGLIEDNSLEVTFSTGIKDKNGVEIFEGDILLRNTESINYSDSYTHSYVEVYRMNTGAYRIKGKPIHDTELISYRKNLLVVGNIYENLELLDKPYYVSEGGGEMRAV